MRQCPPQELDRRAAAVIRQRLGIGIAGVVIHRDMDMIEAKPLGDFGAALVSAYAAACSGRKRLPPPGGMRPSFFTSRWSRSPGCGALLADDLARDAVKAVKT